MADACLARLPLLVLGVIVFCLFYGASLLANRLIIRATRRHRRNLGGVFARLVGAGIILLGFLVGFSIAAPSFQASDLIKTLGIGSLAIGFAFQNILQNFLAGLLLLWTEPFRVGDQIRLDNFEGTVEAIETRATTIKTYDGRRVVIPNADLFTHAVTINTAFDSRRWDYEAMVPAPEKDIRGLKAHIVDAVRKAEGVLAQPVPEVLVVGLGEPGANTLKVCVTWWTRPRAHDMVTTHDRVLPTISEARAAGAANPDEQRAAQFESGARCLSNNHFNFPSLVPDFNSNRIALTL